MNKRLILCPFMLIMLSVVVLQGCFAKHNQVSLIPELGQADHYDKALKKYYQERRVYNDLEVRFYVQAVYLSKDMIEAQVAEYSRLYDLNATEQRTLLNKRLAEYDKEESFFVSVFAPGKNWSKLDMSDTTWKLRVRHLGDYGSEDSEGVKPTKVEQRQLSDPQITYFYPYAKPWAKHYFVSVPNQENASSVELRMLGVVGSHTFRWER